MLDCIFCQIAAHNIPSTIIYEDEHIIVFEDIDPQAPVHVLIVPKKHIHTFADVKENEAEVLQHIFVTANMVATMRNVDHSGFRVVLNCNPDGGQTIYHLHAHLLGGRRLNWP